MDPEQARDLVAGMSRAREMLGFECAPSEQLQARVLAAAREAGVTAEYRQTLDGQGAVTWQAVVRTGRGAARRTIVPDERETDELWEEAFRDLGLLD